MGTTLGTPLIMPDEVHGEEAEPQNNRVPITPEYAPINDSPAPPPPAQSWATPPAPSMGFDPSMGGMGAYYPSHQNRRVGAPSAIASTMNPALGAAMGMSPLTSAGIGVGGAALILTGYLAAMGGLGYWLGGKLAPEEDDSNTYKWAGAVGNVLAPGIGLGAVALIAMLKKD